MGVRAALAEDATALGRVLVESWLSAHRGQVPDAAWHERAERRSCRSRRSLPCTSPPLATARESGPRSSRLARGSSRTSSPGFAAPCSRPTTPPDREVGGFTKRPVHVPSSRPAVIPVHGTASCGVWGVGVDGLIPYGRGQRASGPARRLPAPGWRPRALAVRDSLGRGRAGRSPQGLRNSSPSAVTSTVGGMCYDLRGDVSGPLDVESWLCQEAGAANREAACSSERTGPNHRRALETSSRRPGPCTGGSTLAVRPGNEGESLDWPART